MPRNLFSLKKLGKRSSKSGKIASQEQAESSSSTLRTPKRRLDKKRLTAQNDEDADDADAEVSEDNDGEDETEDEATEARLDAEERSREARYDSLHLTESTEALKRRYPTVYPAQKDTEEDLARKERIRSFASDEHRREGDKLDRATITKDNAWAADARKKSTIDEKDFAYPPGHPLHKDSRLGKGKGR